MGFFIELCSIFDLFYQRGRGRLTKLLIVGGDKFLYVFDGEGTKISVKNKAKLPFLEAFS